MPAQLGQPQARRRSPRPSRTVQAPELRLDQVVGAFFASRIFGPERAALLAAQLPATDAQAHADRDTRTAAIQAASAGSSPRRTPRSWN